MSGVIGGGGLGKIALSYGYYRYQTNIMIVCVVLPWHGAGFPPSAGELQEGSRSDR